MGGFFYGFCGFTVRRLSGYTAIVFYSGYIGYSGYPHITA